MTNIQKSEEFKKLGNQAFQNKNYQQSIVQFSEAIKLNPSNYILYSNRSAAYLKINQYKKALEDANISIDKKSNWVKGYLRKGLALFHLGQIDQSIHTYKKGLMIQPGNISLKQQLEKAKQKKRQTIGSVGEILKNPGETETFLKLVGNPETRHLFQDKQFLQRLQTMSQDPQLFRAMSQWDPKLQKAFQVLNGPVQTNLQDILNPKQKPQKDDVSKKDSKEEKKQVIIQKKQVIGQKYRKAAQQLKNKGNAQFEKRNFEKSLELYTQAINVYPNEVLYYSNRAAVYIELGKYQKAIEQINQAFAIIHAGFDVSNVKISKLYARLASIYAKKQEFEQSIKNYEISLSKDQNPQIKTLLNNVRQQKRKKDQKNYINPEIAQKQFENGNDFFSKMEFEQAFKRYQEAIKRNPDCAKYHHKACQTALKLELNDKAKSHVAAAIMKDPKNIEYFIELGNIHMKLRSYYKAIEAFEKGLLIDKNNKICIKNIEISNKLMYKTPESEQQAAERRKQALKQPQIQRIMEEPQVIDAIRQIQMYPEKSKEIFKKNPVIQDKIRRLLGAGVLHTRK